MIRALLQRFACWRGRHDWLYLYVVGSFLQLTVDADALATCEACLPGGWVSSKVCPCCGATEVFATPLPDEVTWSGVPVEWLAETPHPPGHA